MNPITSLALALAVLAAGGGAAYVKGRHDGAAPYRAQLDTQAARYREEARNLQNQLTLLQEAAAYVHDDAARIVERPVYRNVCLDADGLRVANRALAAASAADAVPAAYSPH